MFKKLHYLTEIPFKYPSEIIENIFNFEIPPRIFLKKKTFEASQ